MTRAATALLDVRRSAALAATLVRLWIGPKLRRLTGRSVKPRGVRFREELERLGLTYIKLGQFLAMRFDLLPADVCRELMHLFEHVTPASAGPIRALVEAELGAPIERLFSFFSDEPVAAASVAQVHEARTLAGERVAVKVQRPDVERVFESDMRNIGRVAALADLIGVFGALSARDYTREFEAWTRRELDFVEEAHTSEKLAALLLEYESVPRVHHALTSRRVLTTEYVDGLSLNELTETLEEGGLRAVRERWPTLDADLVADRASYASLRQILACGFFHGDPHPGNVIVRLDNTLVWVDFGIFGTLTEYLRRTLYDMIETVALGNIDRSFEYYSRLVDPTENTDLRAFERDAKRVLHGWYRAATDPARAPEDRQLGRWLGELTEVLRRHRMRYGPETLLFWRALHALDSTAQRFGPYFDILAALRDFFVRTSPPLLERVADAAPDADRRRLLVDSARLALTRDVARTPWRVASPESESADDRRRENARAKLLATALVIVAAALAAAGASTYSLAAAVAGAALAGALLEVRRA